MLLAFQALVMFFATLVAFGTKVADSALVFSVGGAFVLVMILMPAVLGSKVSYYFGWTVQVLVLLTGIWVPLMWFVGAIFICLWAWAMIAGSTIDKARRNYERQQQAE